MRANLVQATAVALIAVLLGAGPAAAQDVSAQDAPPQDAAPQDVASPDAAAPPSSDQAAPQFTAEQLDQLLAPIALYPDPLLAQILMAASYPLQVVEADRWLQDPNNAALKGDQLAAALDPQPWDPSVKSLVPFPQILGMMDDKLSWTERLGDAFAANQPAVMNSVQRLRARAEAAGKLGSTPQQMVATDDHVITIQPPSTQTVYVPVYDPASVYGPWPYPEFPPYYFPDAFNGFGLGFFGVAVVTPLWGWHHWDWAHRRIDIDRNRVAAFDHFHRPVRSGVWEHDRSRWHGRAMADPAGRGRFAGVTAPASAVGPRVPRRSLTPPGVQFQPNAGGVQPQMVRPQVRPQVIQPQMARPQVQPQAFRPQVRPQMLRPQVNQPQVRPQMIRPQIQPQAFRSFSGRVDVRPQFQRSPAVRTAMPVFRSPAFQPPAFRQSAPRPISVGPRSALQMGGVARR